MGYSPRSQSEVGSELELPRSPGRYLLAIYWIWAVEQRQVRPGEISDRLDVQPASVTEMIDRLDREGYVNYEKHRGVVITDEAKQLARELASSQCTVRAFFADRVGAELTAEEAYRIGYTLPETGIEQMRESVDPACETACPAPSVAAKSCPLKT